MVFGDPAIVYIFRWLYMIHTVSMAFADFACPGLHEALCLQHQGDLSFSCFFFYNKR